MRKHLFLSVVLLVCMLGLTACGGCGENKKTEDELKHFAFNEIDLGVSQGDDADKFVCKGSDIYYVYSSYPDYENMADDVELFNDDESEDSENDDAADAAAEDAAAEGVITDSQMTDIGEQYKITYTIKKYNTESGETSDVYSFEDADTTLDTFYVSDDGTILMLFEKYEYDEKTEISKDSFSLAKVDASGKEVDRKDVTDLFEGYNPETCFFSTEVFDNEGNLYMGYSDGENKYVMLCIAPDGKILSKLAPEKQVDNVIIDSKNNVIALYYDKDNTHYAYVDPQSGKMKEELQGIYDEENQYAYYDMLKGDDQNELYIKNGNSLYAYNSAEATKKLLLNWNDCNLVGDNLNTIIPLGGYRFFIAYYDSDSNFVAGILSESDEKITQKTVLKFASPYMGSDIKELIVKFNKENDTYKVEYVDYDDVEDPEGMLSKDIIAGNVPDIIGTANIDVDNYMAKGILEDLTPYMEKDDYLNKDYYVDGLLDALKVDDKVYYVVDSFNITTLVGKKSDLSAYADGWTFDDLMKYYKSKPEGTKLTDYDTRSSMFYNFCSNSISDFVDWNTGEVKFDSNEFKNLVQFCAQFPSDEEIGDEDMEMIDLHKSIKEGKVLLVQTYLFDTDIIQQTSQLFDGDELYVGYPCSEGYGSYLIFNNSYGIASASSNKDGAWEFIKYVMKNSDDEIIPAGKEAFEKMVKRDMATEPYTDEDGNKVEPRDYEAGIDDGGDGEAIRIGPATKEEIDTLRDMIRRSRVSNQLSDVVTMVEEGIEPFFNGEKGLDETIRVLQDKMTKYVNENK